MSKLAKRIVKAIEKKIHSRKGIGWDHLDDGIKKEIRSELERTVEKELDKTSSEEFSSGR